MKSSPALSETSVSRVTRGIAMNFEDVLAVEEPLEIRLGMPGGQHRAISITMRTPGDDRELAAGFLFTEGILKTPDQIKQIRHCGTGKRPSDTEGARKQGNDRKQNTIRVELQDEIDVDLKRLERNFYTTSSCGVCGKSSIEALQTGAKKLTDLRHPVIDADLIHLLTGLLRASQDVFDQTGGLHASALFSIEGKLEMTREDVGRHNALDKVIGANFLAGDLPLSEKILLVSGRLSFELVQKALMAGIPIVVAVGAPSSLAVELAEEFGMTVIGFVRDGSFNVYSCPERIV
jgi:FdhD protein